MSETYDPDVIGPATRDWQPENRQAMLDYLRASHAREALKVRYANAADLAAALDPNYIITPAIRIISTAIETVLSRPRHNLLVTMSPQEGKSSLCAIYTPLRALQLNPNIRIILCTYGDALAEDHSRICRDLIMRHGSGVIDPMTNVAVEDKLGFSLSTTSKQVSRWRLEGTRGGMVAVGVGGPITGRSADLMIIDDPYKNMMEADSVAHRRKVDEWYRSVAVTRLSPSASTVLIQTRWHPEDLAGTILGDEASLPKDQRTWRHINIPAISEEGLPDALGRDPGVAMESARGRTAEEFNNTRRQVGDRVFYALYQGSPRNPAGGLFLRSWFDPPADPPERPVATVIGIDPADSGEGDDTGIIAAVLDQDGTIVLTEDWSAQMTADQWAHQAVMLALTTGAREIALEAYAAADTYVSVIKRAYRQLHRDAIEKRRAGAVLTGIEKAALPELPSFMVYKWRAGARVDSVGRSALLRQAFETKRARVVETKLSVFVGDACDWQAGQHQPDRVSAAIIAHDRLAELGGGRMTIGLPVDRERGRNDRAPEWLSRKITNGRRPVFDAM